MTHTCHAKNCQKAVPPKMFMCKTHWFALPKEHRDEIWRLYKPGQEVTKTPSREYLNAAEAAIKWLADDEAKKKADAERQGDMGF